ncbi:MAG: ribosome assembly RNA-binding protein YhbY [Magnetococcus sp. YQC-9]
MSSCEDANDTAKGGVAIELTGQQRKYLRGLAHGFQPVVWIGKEGLTLNLMLEVERALEDHELIKIKFNEFKEEKSLFCEEIVAATGCAQAGMIGHVAIFYRPRREVNKRRIVLPVKR